MAIRLCFACLSLLMLAGCKFETDEFWYHGLAQKNYTAYDRVGIPMLAEVFFDNPALITEVRTGTSTTDAEELEPLLVSAITGLRADFAAVPDFPALDDDAKSAAEIAASLVPNVLTVKLDQPIAIHSLNGYGLQSDDGFDAMVKLISGRSALVDGVVEKNVLRNKFPFLDLPAKDK